MNQNEIADLRKKQQELSDKLVSGQINPSDRQSFQKELSRVSEILNQVTKINDFENNINESKKQAQESTDPELKQLFLDEALELETKLLKEKETLEDMLFPKDELDSSSVFMEIRAGTGGQEAALFVADLLRMYTNYALKKGWQPSLVDFSQTDLKGYREVILYIKGKDVYGHLKHESGVHRVQRVPLTETSGRIHTSTVTVAVFPEITQDTDFEISPTDLRIDVFRAGGAGGQHVNKTESAVRITHIPTGVVATCQDDRSQHKNKEKALKMLKSRLATAAREKQEAEMQQKRKELVGKGSRAEKARTYNFPQNRVTDHQAEITLNKLDFIIEGYLDEIIDALRQKEKLDRRVSL